ncbi:killer toxin alpha/beta [Nannizzia gypsea CBS 118893]|uniref:chitinase n=1 Tax=Arthroderma gypseum (strain ATCC MYA-4604 / CBS 118893) TaxID=535722 RepID=E4UMN3_ARTGP|nr:killer toxin alpha/beta [Nannizzia gypsea CBS 118893]EFQ99450.1 killer toxin alpha/beta [Nannizzia gypsea CBS 118893]
MRPDIWSSGTGLAISLLAVGVPARGFDSQLRPCPQHCAGPPSNWTVYTSTDRLRVCEQPILFDFAIHTPINGQNRHTKLRACTAGDANDVRNALTTNRSTNYPRDGSCCIASARQKTVTLDVKTSGRGQASSQDTSSALGKVRSYLQDFCDETFIVGYSKEAVVAVYSGSAIDNKATISPILDRLPPLIGYSKTAIVQLCGQGRNADHTFGIAVDTTGDVAAVQKAVVSWSNATCFDLNGDNVLTRGLDRAVIAEAPFQEAFRFAVSEGECRTISVVSGDSCGALAQRCGISANDFTKYNPDPNLCSTLAVGQRVCCSPGTLPDIRPKPGQDGFCASYTVKSGDTCSAIAASNGLKVEDLGKFNDKTTWGWFGCNALLAGTRICLSLGYPPMPAPVPNAVCGPIKPGTKADPKRKLADLNPCVLNSCCDIWGQCGITPDFCTAEEGPTGNPGTAPPGHNGCISNCGTNIKTGDAGPSSFINIGYYESWNFDRSCLNMRVKSIEDTFTHLHWGFGLISPSFDISVNDIYKQWGAFTSLYDIKKIVSFGGWGYSTEPATYEILRKAMNPENVDTFTDNVIKFIKDNNLDGVDFDWEYPGAPDIPGIPPGLETDGPNYLAMLRKVRGKLPQGKTLSIAAPASFWYLRPFPIDEMAKELDYIVYMTYDLHGQWDAGNQWSQEGCPGGNCLRSHVNLTETNYALAMITKAGVPANKVVVGIASYGRSFGMLEEGCTSPDCRFGGDRLHSTAKEGRCTRTAGYISNAEINEILITNDNAKTWYDRGSASNIITYNGKEWAAFMNADVKRVRAGYYKRFNFAGVVDWAVDLDHFTDDDGSPEGEEYFPPAPSIAKCDAGYATLEDLDAAAGDIPQHCKAYYTARALSNLLEAAVKNYTMILNNGYAGKFKTYSKAVAGSASNSVHDFVYKNGDKYFSCIVSETSECCKVCMQHQKRPGYCNYCHNGECYIQCDTELGCPPNSFQSIYNSSSVPPGMLYPIETPVVVTQNVSEPCPPDYSKRGEGPDNPYQQAVYWTLENSKADKFYADLFTSTGIPKEKTKIGNFNRGQNCAPSAEPEDVCHAFDMDYGIPVPNGYGEADVLDPQKTVAEALENSKDLMAQVRDAVYQLKLMSYNGDSSELVDSISVPILMIASGVESMAQVEEVAEKIDEAKRKALILGFLGAILFFVPIAGQVLGAVTELSSVAAILTILGTAGEVALDIYSIVDDPDNAPLAIFGLILTPLGLNDLAAISKAAAIRRGLTDADVAKLGKMVSRNLGTIKKVMQTCRKA